MRLLVIALVLLFQNTEIKPRLSAGDAFRLEITRIRENSQRPQGNGTSRTLVDVRVISAGATGWVLDWTAGPTSFDNPLIAKDPLVAAASRAVQQVPFRLVLNAEGEFVRIANEAQIVQQMQSGTNAMINELAATLTAVQRQQFESMLRQVLTPETLISAATREVQIYFALNGAALNPGEAVDVPLQQPSPTGGGMIPATYRVRMDSSTPASANLSTATIYDGEAMRSMTAALFKQMGPVSQSELAALPALQITDDGKYSFDRTLGIMREATVNRRISAGPIQRLDGWAIRLLSGPKR